MKKFYQVGITEIISTPTAKVPKSKAIVELRVREGDEEAARQRAMRAAESAFGFLFRNKRVEKVSYEVTEIEPPTSVPKFTTVIVPHSSRSRRKHSPTSTWFTQPLS